ncbi:D,D-heptose 1,7-bisphosphate phosphatase [bacterium]|nr:D,D-heptose 1,7-bisphosphate phosphatase [bacterium]
MMQRAIFLDRDGTINHDPGYIKDPSEIKILPGVAEGIKKLKNDFGCKIIVVSNQAGVAKGLMTLQDVDAVNQRVNELLFEQGTSVDAFYYCPYHPDIDPPEKSICRKPSPLMIVQAAEEFDIDLTHSYMVGDKWSDVECGINAGVKTILLDSPTIEKEISVLLNLGKKPNFTAANFSEACDFVIIDLSGGN